MRQTFSKRLNRWTVYLDDGRRMYHYRYVMEQHLGRPLTPHEQVHHINGDPSDDRLENLQLTSPAEHAALHRGSIGPKRTHPEHAPLAVALYRQGLSLSQVANELGYRSQTPILAFLKEAGEPRRAPSINNRPAPTHCKNGHPFDEENTQFDPGSARGRPQRVCLACRRARGREFMRRKRAEKKAAM